MSRHHSHRKLESCTLVLSLRVHTNHSSIFVNDFLTNIEAHANAFHVHTLSPVNLVEKRKKPFFFISSDASTFINDLNMQHRLLNVIAG